MKTIFISAIAATLALSGCAPAPPPVPPVRSNQAALLDALKNPTMTRTALSGQELKLGFATALNPDCSQAGKITIRIIQQPGNGQLRFEQGSDFTNFAPGNQRYHCNLKKVPGTLAFYESNPGFMGTDQFRIEQVTDQGVDQTVTYNIIVK